MAAELLQTYGPLILDDKAAPVLVHEWLPVVTTGYLVAEAMGQRLALGRPAASRSPSAPHARPAFAHLALLALKASSGRAIVSYFLGLDRPAHLDAAGYFYPLLFVCWLLVNYFPGDLFYKLLNLWLVKLAVSFVQVAYRTRVLEWVVLTAASRTDNAAIVLFAAILHPVPGELIMALLTGASDPLAFLNEPTWSVKSAALAGAAYIVGQWAGFNARGISYIVFVALYAKAALGLLQSLYATKQKKE